MSAPCADAWLHAPPDNETGVHMPSELFRLAAPRRLGVNDYATCPCCGARRDFHMDRALVFSCGGDRTLHNTIRDMFLREAEPFPGQARRDGGAAWNRFVRPSSGGRVARERSGEQPSCDRLCHDFRPEGRPHRGRRYGEVQRHMRCRSMVSGVAGALEFSRLIADPPLREPRGPWSPLCESAVYARIPQSVPATRESPTLLDVAFAPE